MSEEKSIYSHLKGNAHAQKYDTPANAALSLRCNADDKARWQEAAKAENVSLNQWIIKALNSTKKPSD